MKTFSRQRTSKTRAVLLLLAIFGMFAIVCFGLVFYVGNLAKYQEAISARENQAILREVNDPGQLDQALKQFPSNGILKLVALANRQSIEIDAATQKRLSEVEPGTLAKPGNLTKLGRGDLDALRRDLKTAQTNVTTFEPGYVALVKAERDKIGNEARSLKVEKDTFARFMAAIDERDKEMMAITSKVLAARLEYYRAYEKCAELLVKEFGVYRIENGQFVFPFQYSAEGYIRAVTAMTAASTRVAELEEGRATVRQSQFKRWKALADPSI